jgi:hypothetical protein
MSERLSNLGYFGLIKQADPNTMLTPTDFIPLFDETMSTMMNFVDQEPIYGQKEMTFTTLQGTRSHKGDVTVLAEPNTTAKLYDMLLQKTSTTGAGPYTHTFSLTGNANSYTIDISTGNVVSRYWGVQASAINQNWNKTELQWKVSVSALGSFQGRTIASVPTGSGPYSVTLDTSYDPNPTTGLVVGDLIRFYHSPTSTIDATITAITNGTTFTTTTNVLTLLQGDMVYLRPATPSFSTLVLNTFIWPRTQFQFGATAAAALSAAQLRVETGSTYTITHDFESADGSARSGSFDPASLPRLTGDAALTVKKFFDTPDDVALLNGLIKTASVVRHFQGSANQYECRVTFNHLKTDGKIIPDIKSKSVAYSEIKYHTNYDITDGQAFQVTVINGLATI